MALSFSLRTSVISLPNDIILSIRAYDLLKDVEALSVY